MRLRTAALAGALMVAATAAANAEPKTNMLHQWSEGSDAAAIAKLGDMFTAAGGKWEQTSIAGHTANTLAKLRADVESPATLRRPSSSRDPRSRNGTRPA